MKMKKTMDQPLQKINNRDACQAGVFSVHSLKLLIILFALIIIALLVTYEANERTVSHPIKIGAESINIFTQDNRNYLFLPSFADKDSIQQIDNNIIIMQSSNLPAIFIDTASGEIDNVYADKEYRETGKIKIINPDGSTEYKGKLKSIKGRGNYSWNNWSKKSFSIDLGHDNNIFGLSSGGNYVLQANASDPTLIRNELARQMEREIGTKYVPLGEFVDLYINGDYMGNYYLNPTMTIGAERINITNLEEEMDRMYSSVNYEGFTVYETPTIKGWNIQDNPEDITGGYLLEREFTERYNTEYDSNSSGFETADEECFVVKSPEYCSREEIHYIASYVQEIEDAILAEDGVNPSTGKSIKDYIDMESFACWYLVNEVAKNYDAGISSAYYYKDSDLIDSKLYMSSGWDFDMSLGNYLDWMSYYNEPADGLTKASAEASANRWIIILYDNDEFQSIFTRMYKDIILPYLQILVNEKIDDYQARLSASASMDAIRWADMYNEKGYMVGDNKPYEELKDFIAVRMDYLSKEWNIE